MARQDAKKTKAKKIRYAVVGMGHIAQIAVLPAFKSAKTNSELVALVTGDDSKGKALKRKYPGVEIYSYKGYESLLQSGLADAVYIALPNDMHYEYAKKALENGLHVLCEKPFTLKTEEAQELDELAEISNLKLMVAYRLHFEEANLKAVEFAKNGKLGTLRYFDSNFSFQVTDPDNIRLKAERGGGPLLDIGIYCINASRYIFQDDPIEVLAMSETQHDSRFKEVNEMVSVIMRYPKQRMASFNCSFGAEAIAEYLVVGTDGYIKMQNAYEYVEPRVMEYKLKGQKNKKTKKFKKSDQFAPELVYFSDCIIENKPPEPGPLEGLIDTQVVAAILESIRVGRSVHLNYGDTKTQRPSEKQKIYRAPHKKVDVIKSPSPHS